MTERFTESTVESAALGWLAATGWRVAYGPDVAPDMPAAERGDYGEVVLARRQAFPSAGAQPYDQPPCLTQSIE
jgi:hypothetical protein